MRSELELVDGKPLQMPLASRGSSGVHCIQLIEASGGSYTIRASTEAECRAKAARVTGNGRRFLCCTLPFAIRKVPSSLGGTIYDVSIPHSWRAELGEEMMSVYKDHGEP